MTAFAKLPLITAAIMLSACGGAPVANNSADNAANEQAPPANVAEPGNAAQDNAEAISFKEGESEFRYSWPKEAADIAPLNALMRATGEKFAKETRDGIQAEQASTNASGYPFRGYNFVEDWSVVANLPALMVLESENYSYTGGAHGITVVKPLYWYKAAAKSMAVVDLFDVNALAAAVRTRFCKALDAQRAEKRGAPVNPEEEGGIPEFNRCVDPAKQTIIPASKGGKALDTVRFVIMPYEAGPYVEGIYDIALPVDAATLATVKPAWKASFGAGN